MQVADSADDLAKRRERVVQMNKVDREMRQSKEKQQNLAMTKLKAKMNRKEMILQKAKASMARDEVAEAEEPTEPEMPQKGMNYLDCC